LKGKHSRGKERPKKTIKKTIKKDREINKLEKNIVFNKTVWTGVKPPEVGENLTKLLQKLSRRIERSMSWRKT